MSVASYSRQSQSLAKLKSNARVAHSFLFIGSPMSLRPLLVSITILNMLQQVMGQKKAIYSAPSVQIVEVAADKSILAISDPVLNNPYSGGGEDW